MLRELIDGTTIGLACILCLLVLLAEALIDD